jgi:hypothetical protein
MSSSVPAGADERMRPIVRCHMRAKQFTRDIIDTLGKRLFEVLLPNPKNAELAARITMETKKRDRNAGQAARTAQRK